MTESEVARVLQEAKEWKDYHGQIVRDLLAVIQQQQATQRNIEELTTAWDHENELRRDAEEALAALQAERQTLAVKWQPIETAPKKIRAIVASYYPREDVGWMIGEAFRDSIGVWWWAQTMPNDGDLPDVAIDPQPTHWMPLPDPPTPTGTGAPK